MAIAGVPISTLRELVIPASDDYLVINDQSTLTTKKITFANLFADYASNLRDSATGAFVNNFTTNSLNVKGNASVTGDATVLGTINFENLYDVVEGITISKFVDEADGIASNDNDTSIPTSAAIKAYVDGAVSDYRAKENIKPFGGALKKLNGIKAYEYNLITEPGVTEVGFIAHELQERLPTLVNGEKDAVYESGKPKYQTVNYAKMVPILFTAIRELEKQVRDLRDQLAEIKG